MAPHQLAVTLQSTPSMISQKVQLTYQLFLLENARNKLEQDLRNFTIKVKLAASERLINEFSYIS